MAFKGTFGKQQISAAIQSFERVHDELENGIKLCVDQRQEHLDKMTQEQKTADELGEHIERARRVQGKIKQIIE